MILLDTQSLLWIDKFSTKIGEKTLQKIAEEEQAVSAISFWETAMLVEKSRVYLGKPLLSWRNDLLQTGLVELPVTGEIGIRAAQLQGFHGDPEDRIITATALHYAATLMTADAKILSWKGALESWDVRR